MVDAFYLFEEEEMTKQQYANKTIITNEQYEVEITPKIYDNGFTLTKRPINDPLTIIEIRDIRLPLSENALLSQAKALLNAVYDLVDSKKPQLEFS